MGIIVVAAAALGDVPSLSVVRTKALLAEFLLSYDKIAVEQEGVQAQVPTVVCSE
jgi:hypothetical protein